MGRFPLHKHDVALVLNRDFSLVIPQFHVRYDPLFATNKDYDLSSLSHVRTVFVWQEGHTLSRADRADTLSSLSSHPCPQKGGKRARLDPSASGRHSQPEGDSGSHSQKEVDPDVHISPQEGASSDNNTSQPGGAYQPDTIFS